MTRSSTFSQLYRAVFIFVLCIISGGLISGCSEHVSCAATWGTADPAIDITAAINRQTGDTVSQYIIKDVLIDGAPVDPTRLVNATNPKATATIDGSVLRCNRQCSWGAEPGTYRFTVAATGIADQTFTLKMAYQKLVSNPSKCISHNQGGLAVTLLL